MEGITLRTNFNVSTSSLEKYLLMFAEISANVCYEYSENLNVFSQKTPKLAYYSLQKLAIVETSSGFTITSEAIGHFAILFVTVFSGDSSQVYRYVKTSSATMQYIQKLRVLLPQSQPAITHMTSKKAVVGYRFNMITNLFDFLVRFFNTQAGLRADSSLTLDEDFVEIFRPPFDAEIKRYTNTSLVTHKLPDENVRITTNTPGGFAVQKDINFDYCGFIYGFTFANNAFHCPSKNLGTLLAFLEASGIKSVNLMAS